MHQFSLFCHVLHVCSWAGLVHANPDASPTKAIEQAANRLTASMPGVWAIRDGGAWTLAQNDLWNIPEGLSGSKFEVKYAGQYGFQYPTALRGLAMTMTGQILGIRSLSDMKQEGYACHGRVSIGGKKRRAFTSTRLFQRPDKSLVNVDVLIVNMDP